MFDEHIKLWEYSVKLDVKLTFRCKDQGILDKLKLHLWDNVDYHKHTKIKGYKILKIVHYVSFWDYRMGYNFTQERLFSLKSF